MQNDLALLVKRAAQDSMGIYPASIIEADNTVKHRTEWQDGWNAAVIELNNKEIAVHNWLKSLPPDQIKIITKLFLNDIINIDVDDHGIEIDIPLNDVFVQASEALTITLFHLKILDVIFDKYGYEGTIAWASSKLSMEPLSDRIKNHPNYIAAKKELPE